jgi:hypothetical protein
MCCTAAPYHTVLLHHRYRENVATVDSALAKYPEEVRANKNRVRDLQAAMKVGRFCVSEFWFGHFWRNENAKRRCGPTRRA